MSRPTGRAETTGIPEIGRPEIKIAIGRSGQDHDCHVTPFRPHQFLLTSYASPTHLLRAGRKVMQDLLNRIADPLLALLGPTR